MTDAPAANASSLLAAIAAVSDPATPADAIGEVFNAVDSLYERAKELREMARSAALEHMQALGVRTIIIGGKEWRAEYPTKTSNVPEQKRRTLRELFDACGGDMDAVADCLYADPFKTSEAKSRLPADVYRQCFRTTSTAKLVAGKAQPVLMQAWEAGR